MISPTAAGDDGGARGTRPSALTMTITREGLVLGTSLLAAIDGDAFGSAGPGVEGAEQRILALLSTSYGKSVGPRVLNNIRRASQYWRKGEASLAAIELALTGLPPLPDQEQASFRLLLGEKLLTEGVTPRDLMNACGFDLAPLDLVKTGFNPGQPRVPAGNPDGGQWTSGDGSGEVGGSASPAEPERLPTSASGAVIGSGHSKSRPRMRNWSSRRTAYRSEAAIQRHC